MLSLIFAAALGVPTPQTSAHSGGDPSAVVSLDRIRVALAAPSSRLTLPNRTPDFVVDVTERQRFERLVAPFLQFDGGARQKPFFFASQPQAGTTPALAAIDLLGLVAAAKRQLSSARSGRAADTARAGVARAIAEYCAAQPNAGAAIRICMDPTSVR